MSDWGNRLAHQASSQTTRRCPASRNRRREAASVSQGRTVRFEYPRRASQFKLGPDNGKVFYENRFSQVKKRRNTKQFTKKRNRVGQKRPVGPAGVCKPARDNERGRRFTKRILQRRQPRALRKNHVVRQHEIGKRRKSQESETQRIWPTRRR